jgi:hypothetical protein
MTSINTVFKRIFGMTLTPLGFVYLKQIKYFGRMVNGEILQFLSLINMHSGIPEHKGFAIVAGIKSIYAESFAKDHLLFCAPPLAHLLGVDGDIDQARQLISISYNEATMEEAVTFALKKTLGIAMPKLDEITDLDACIEFYKKYPINMLRGAHKFSNDSLLLIKANNHDDFMKELNDAMEKGLKRLKQGDMGGDENDLYNNLYHGLVETIAGSRDKVYNDPELYAQALAEMERRKVVNLEVIRSYGLDV